MRIAVLLAVVLPLVLADTGPPDVNPAKGTGCARVNAERMGQGIETDYWDGGFFFETYVDGCARALSHPTARTLMRRSLTRHFFADRVRLQGTRTSTSPSTLGRSSR